MVQHKKYRFIFIVALISFLILIGTNQVFAYGGGEEGDGSGTGPNEGLTPPTGFKPDKSTKNVKERVPDQFVLDVPGTGSVGTGDSQRSTEDQVAIDQEDRDNASPTERTPVTLKDKRDAKNEFLDGLSREEKEYFQSLGATSGQMLEAKTIRRYAITTRAIQNPVIQRLHQEMVNSLEAQLYQDIKNTHLSNEQQRQAAIQRLQRYQDFCAGLSLNIVTAPLGGIGIGINIGINALAGGGRGAATSSAAALAGHLAGPAPNLIAGAFASSIYQETLEMSLEAGENK